MKNIKMLLVAMLFCNCLFASVIRRGQWVYWTEVNQSGQKVIAVGKVIGKDLGQGTYRIEAGDKWKMHLKKEALNVLPGR